MSPMTAVGVKARDRKWAIGNQNQNCVNTSMPTMDGMCVWPVRDCSEMVTFRPPAEEKNDRSKREKKKKARPGGVSRDNKTLTWLIQRNT